MAVICAIAGHRWHGCQCERCKKTRDEGHDWDGCVCRTCGQKRDRGHVFGGCTCIKCGWVRGSGHHFVLCGTERVNKDHQYVEVSHYACSICGEPKEDVKVLGNARKELTVASLAQIPYKDFSLFGRTSKGYNILIFSAAYGDELPNFYSLETLEEIQVKQEHPLYTCVDGVLYDKAVQTLLACPRARVREIIIPNTVTFIAEKAFSGCDSLTGISIPDGADARGRFFDCRSLRHVTLNKALYGGGLCALFPHASLTDGDFAHDYDTGTRMLDTSYSDDDNMKAGHTEVVVIQTCRRCGHVHRSYES